MFKSKHRLELRDLLTFKKMTCFVLLAWPITYCGRPNSDDGSYDIAAANNNGDRVSPLEHPSVVRIIGPQGNVCTGTLIGNNKVLSAGHCGLDHSGKDLNASGVRMDIAGQSYSPSAINVHPEYKKNFDPNLNDHTREKNDLAVFDLPPGARIPENTARDFGQTAAMGQNVTIAGYGHRSFGGAYNPSTDPAGILRKGTNTVGKVNDGLIELTPSGLGTPSFQTGNTKDRGNIGPNSTQYDPTRTQGAPGDSGGPLFNDKGEVIGVASGAFYSPNNKGPNGQPNVDYQRTTSYIDLSHESNKKWIDSQFKGPGPHPSQAQVQAPAMRPVQGQGPGQVPGNLRPAPTVGARPTPAGAPRPGPVARR